MFDQYIINDYLRAGVIFLGLLIVMRIFVSSVQRIVLRMVRKTKTNLDDILIERASFPITLFLFFISLRIAVNEIAFSEISLKYVHSIIYSGLAISIGFLVYAIIDVLIVEAWQKVTRKAKLGSAENLASLIRGILKILVLVFVALYILDLWGVQITPLLAGLGLAGLAVALAIQPVLANVFSGVAMIVDKTIRVGDLVYLENNTKGKISNIGLRTTRITTFDNETIIVPNTKLAESNIQNVTLPEPKSRVVVQFSVAYGSDVERVKKIVLAEIIKIKKFTKVPEPGVRFVEMAASSLNFKAYFYVESYEDRFNAIDEANTRIYNILNKNKIKIPYPTLDVNLKK